MHIYSWLGIQRFNWRSKARVERRDIQGVFYGTASIIGIQPY
jgi:hypothetical protein